MADPALISGLCIGSMTREEVRCQRPPSVHRSQLLGTIPGAVQQARREYLEACERNPCFVFRAFSEPGFDAARLSLNAANHEGEIDAFVEAVAELPRS